MFALPATPEGETCKPWRCKFVELIWESECLIDWEKFKREKENKERDKRKARIGDQRKKEIRRKETKDEEEREGTNKIPKKKSNKEGVIK